MTRAGCRYISISPETGSARLLKEMRKPFNLEHAVRMGQTHEPSWHSVAGLLCVEISGRD